MSKPHPPLLDLSGERFGRLTAVARSPERFGRYRRTAWICRCDCGKTVRVLTADLRTGNTRSCGCFFRDLQSTRKRTHGFTCGSRKPRLYRIWTNMRQRCLDPNYTNAHRWGGRGITVCDEWSDFEVFRSWAVANGYADGLSIDRIDNDGNYEPSNCRWATPKEQARNTRSTRYLTHNGVTLPAADWADRIGMTSKAVTYRIDRLGWSVARAVTTPNCNTRRSVHEQGR